MKIVLEQSDQELEVIIRGNLSDSKVQTIISTLHEIKQSPKIVLHRDEKEYFADIEEIHYFTCCDHKVYAYLGAEPYEVKQKLYEILKMVALHPFIQINKSTIVNINCIHCVEAEFSGNYIAILKDHKTKLLISRIYMKTFRQKVLEG